MAIPASNGKTVLITGINGYIASVLGLHLLEKGYSLRGTSRRTTSVEPLLKGAYAAYQDRVKIYEVSDMTVAGAFDEAVKGVDGIFHTASPIDFSLTTYEQMIVPAEKGAETILNSALKAGPQLTSVVLTSSTAAVVNPDKEPNYTFTEADWASAALEKAIKDRDEGVQTPGGVLYSASKTASDRVVWRFRDAHKPSFAITTINPSVVIGPPVVLPVSGDKLNETLRPVFNILAGNTGGKNIVPPNIGTASFVDVRDVAFLHTWAYENPAKADGERYLATQGFGPLQAAVDILRYEYKDRPEILEKIPVGKPGDGYHGYDESTGEVSEVIGWSEGRFRVSGKKAEREMGVKYISFRKSVVDTAKAFEPLL